MPDDMDLPVGPLQVGILPSSLQGSQGPTRWAYSDIITYLPPSVPEYNQGDIDQDVLSTYTSLDDYDAMFEARHGRGAVDNNLVTTGGMVSATFPMTLPSQTEPVHIRASNKDPMTRQIPTYTPSSIPPLSSQPDQTPVIEYQPQVEEFYGYTECFSR